MATWEATEEVEAASRERVAREAAADLGSARAAAPPGALEAMVALAEGAVPFQAPKVGD